MKIGLLHYSSMLPSDYQYSVCRCAVAAVSVNMTVDDLIFNDPEVLINRHGTPVRHDMDHIPTRALILRASATA